MKILKYLAAFLALSVSTFQSTSAQEGTTDVVDYHDNVVIVLDASGSMKQNMRGTRVKKMQAAKDALKAVIENVSPATHIGLLVFSSKNLKNDWAYPLGPQDQQALAKAIDLPIANRGTPLGEYIKIGADRLLEARKKQYGYGSYRLLVVTDGEANDPELVDRYSPLVLARGITMDVIGVDMEQDHTLATMAHSYRRANDPDSLEQAIREVFAELSADSGDFSMDEAFELLAPFPVESAAAALQALSTSGNEPIGSADSNQTSPQRKRQGQANAAQQSRNAHQQHTTHVTVQSNFSNLVKVGIVVFIILMVLVKKLF